MRRTGLLGLAVLVLIALPLPATAQDGPTAACPPGSTDGHAFTDLDGNVHEPAIECLTAWEVVSGTSASRYSPAAAVSRGQAASFLARLHTRTLGHLPDGRGFTDTEGSVHADAIAALASAGVLAGYPDGTFRPNEPVTRAQLASVVHRAFRYRTYAPAPPDGPDAFTDIEGSVHREAINALAALGFVGGRGDGRFEPDAPVRRDQAASMLARFLDHLVAEGYSLPLDTACTQEWPPPGLEVVAVLAPGDLAAEEVLVAVTPCSWIDFSGWWVANDRGEEVVVADGMVLHAGTMLSIRSTAGQSRPPEAFGGRDQPMWRSGDRVRLFDADGLPMSEHRVGETYEVTASAELADATAPVPFTVEAIDPGALRQGEDTSHAVRFTGTAGTVYLHDPRLSGVLRHGEGQLVAAGRGCFPNYDPDRDEVFLVCTDDFQYLRVDHGSTSDTEVGLHTDPEHVGPRRVLPGTYRSEERLAWSRSTVGPVEGEVTVRITYTVRGEEPQG